MKAVSFLTVDLNFVSIQFNCNLPIIRMWYKLIGKISSLEYLLGKMLSMAGMKESHHGLGYKTKCYKLKLFVRSSILFYDWVPYYH